MSISGEKMVLRLNESGKNNIEFHGKPKRILF
jgi:hypothetical protein